MSVFTPKENIGRPLSVISGHCDMLKRCPLWVISGHFAMREPCPLYPRRADIHRRRRHVRSVQIADIEDLLGKWSRTGQDNPDFSELTELRTNLD